MKILVLKIVVYFILVLVLLQVLIPLGWILLSSLKVGVSQFYMPPQLFFYPSIDNYAGVFSRFPFAYYYLNSLMISSATTVLILLIGLPAAYYFSRFGSSRTKFLELAIVASRGIPPVSVLIVFAIFVKGIGLYDKHIVLIVLYLFFNLGFTVWFGHQLFNQIPPELDEAALIDGLSRMGTFFRVIIPLSVRGIITIGIFDFLLAWNEFMYPLILTAENAKTLPVVLASFVAVHGIEWGQMSAAGILTIIPTIIFGALVWRSFAEGIKFSTGIK